MAGNDHVRACGWQQRFLEGFKAWNEEDMTAALVGLLDVVRESETTEDERKEINWRCRELLYNLDRHPNLNTSLSVGGFDVLVNVHARGVDANRPKRYAAVSLELRLAATSAADVKQRWSSLGLGTAEDLPRDQVRAPSPLKWEPGYETRKVPPSIHSPVGERGALPSSTYAHALRAETRDGNRWLARYLAGDHAAVWREMLVHGPEIRRDPLLGDAVAVARETMRRCRHNVEVVTQRLRRIGHVFAEPAEAHQTPLSASLAQIADLERKVGALPLSVCAFLEIVGPVNWSGDARRWLPDVEYPDALVVEFPEYCENDWWRRRYRMPFAPDAFHKEDVSGGPPYTWLLPDASCDTRVQHERHETTFVNYLRICFASAGFPGGEASKERPAARILQELARDLMPI